MESNKKENVSTKILITDKQKAILKELQKCNSPIHICRVLSIRKQTVHAQLQLLKRKGLVINERHIWLLTSLGEETISTGNKGVRENEK